MSNARLFLLTALAVVAVAPVRLHHHQSALRTSHYLKPRQGELAPYLTIKNKAQQKRHLNTDHDLEPDGKHGIQLPARVSPWQRFS